MNYRNMKILMEKKLMSLEMHIVYLQINSPGEPEMLRNDLKDNYG